MERGVLTHERLLELMHYDPETGVMRRKTNRYAATVGVPAGNPNGGYNPAASAA